MRAAFDLFEGKKPERNRYIKYGERRRLMTGRKVRKERLPRGPEEILKPFSRTSIRQHRQEKRKRRSRREYLAARGKSLKERPQEL